MCACGGEPCGSEVLARSDIELEFLYRLPAGRGLRSLRHGGPGRSRLVSSIGSRGRGEKFRTLRKSYPHPMVGVDHDEDNHTTPSQYGATPPHPGAGRDTQSKILPAA